MTDGPGEQRRRWLDTLAVFAFAWVWLSLRGEAPLNPDQSRDLAFARDLVTGAELHRHGAWASFVALQQGTAWIDLLAACERAGLGIVGIGRVLTTLLAFTVAATQLGVAATLRAAGSRGPMLRFAAIAAALVLLASLPVTCEMPILWQPLLLPLPVAFVHLSAWRVIDRGELIDCVALGLVCALALDVHVVAVVLFAAPLLLVPLAAARPVIATAASLLAALGFLALSSWTALLANWRIASEQGWLLPAALLGLALVGLAAALRGRFGALPLRRRLELCVAIEALLVAGLILASRLDATPGLTGRYLLPFVPGLALAVALLLIRGGGTRGRAGVVALVLLLGLAAARPWRFSGADDRELALVPAYSQRELERIGEWLRQRGYSWTDLAVRLQGPARQELLGGLSAQLEPGPPQAPDVRGGLLLITLEPERADAALAELPASAAAVELDGATTLLVETPSRLDRRAPAICPDAGECVATTLAVTRRVNQARPKAWIGAQPVDKWLRAEVDGPIERITWRLPVRPGPAAVLVLAADNSPGYNWEFVAVEGFELAAGALPSAVVELPAEAAGTLTIARAHSDDPELCRHGAFDFPPAPIELEPGWVELRAAVGASLK